MHRFSIENFSRTRPGLGAGRATQYLTRTGEFADQNADRVETIRTDATFQIEHMTGENFPEGHRNDLRHVEVNNSTVVFWPTIDDSSSRHDRLLLGK